MSRSDRTFILVATYPDEAAAREVFQFVKDADAAGLVGSPGAAWSPSTPAARSTRMRSNGRPPWCPVGASRPGRRSVIFPRRCSADACGGFAAA